ncbi:MAG: helix-turn-helix domain-containing protein [Desulfovibrio sp.]|nr:helix-turn-helix domain-containing protein [Desulfovibrio sp.]
MPKKKSHLPATQCDASIPDELLNFCTDIAPALGNAKIRLDLTRHGGTIHIKTPDTPARQIQIAPGYKEMSVGSIKGLPHEEQEAAVRHLREQGFTQAQVAARLNVSQSYISHIENR